MILEKLTCNSAVTYVDVERACSLALWKGNLFMNQKKSQVRNKCKISKYVSKYVCQDVSSFGNIHPLATACQDVSSFIRWPRS